MSIKLATGMSDSHINDKQPPAWAFKFLLVERAASTIKTAIPWVAAVAISYFLFDALKAYAGEQTDLTLLLSLFLDSNPGLTITISIGVTAIFGFLYRRERRLRYITVERLEGRIRELETRLDPGRTSSGLTPQGRTNPMDL